MECRSPREKSCTLFFDAHVSDPYYLRAKVNGRSPYDERVMSMPQLPISSSAPKDRAPQKYRSGSYFFFLFNLENYYHFLYDTLPYLWFYFRVAPRPKLLLAAGHTFRPFQTEMLQLLGIDLDADIEFAEENVLYEKLYVATSLTHGHTHTGESASNSPPECEAHSVWQQLAAAVPRTRTVLPQKFYVSRRTHLHGDMSNIGTNYTTRRRCLNEDEVVAVAAKHGYAEIFCEKLSTAEKLALFQNATHVLGFIGGGMANCLFSGSATHVGCIMTPEFDRINARFAHSMSHTDMEKLEITGLAPHEGPFPLYTRVIVKDAGSPYYNKIGEVYGYKEDMCEVHLSVNTVAGFSLDAVLTVAFFPSGALTPLDTGLNSPFVCDVEALKLYLESKGD